MTEFPLPPYAHLPGRNPRHDPGIFSAIKAATPPVTRSDAVLANPAWRHGLDLLRAGYYWESHEVLEPVWLNAPPNSRERMIVQAVIQLANAALKQRLGKPRAARRLAEISASLAGEVGVAPVMGIDPKDVARLARAPAELLARPLVISLDRQ